MERVITYIDGFNLYFGLQSAGWRSMLWLDLHALSGELLIKNQKLVHSKYFTARVGSPGDKVKRQNTYIEALQTLPETSLYFGKFLLSPRTCPKCKFQDYVPSEKMTDVNIAVEMLADAFEDRFDTAILISGDSDLCENPNDFSREARCLRLSTESRLLGTEESRQRVFRHRPCQNQKKSIPPRSRKQHRVYSQKTI